MSHIAVERKRRRQMNEHLKVLRALTPSFYVKRGDQASIIGGVIEFIKELQQVHQSLEAKKKRKTNLSPITTQFTAESNNLKEVVASCKSPMADVQARISGSNVILRTISRRIPGQLVKIIFVLERFSFQILQLNIDSIDDYALFSFVIKIGVECQLSMEELALEVQRSFCTQEFHIKEM
ncbi:hypothetical protein Leryth_006294 [Lithospermum erythrorhizon]|nr:hypothetical protein Leryth_006294 [Lithospermum erythrorhizon]